MTEQKSIEANESKHNAPFMLSIRETANRTGVSYDHIRKLCLNGKIRFIRCGSKFLINYPLFIRYLNGEEEDK